MYLQVRPILFHLEDVLCLVICIIQKGLLAMETITTGHSVDLCSPMSVRLMHAGAAQTDLHSDV